MCINKSGAEIRRNVVEIATELETRCCVLLKCRQLRVRVERVLMGVLPMLAVAVTYF